MHIRIPAPCGLTVIADKQAFLTGQDATAVEQEEETGLLGRAMPIVYYSSSSIEGRQSRGQTAVSSSIHTSTVVVSLRARAERKKTSVFEGILHCGSLPFVTQIRGHIQHLVRTSGHSSIASPRYCTLYSYMPSFLSHGSKTPRCET